MRGPSRVALVSLLVAAVVVHAGEKFLENSNAASPTAPQEPSLQDYMDFGK
jgi:hypothetical protein